MPEYSLKELKIEVTYRCPLACVHCSSEADEYNTHEMTKDTCLEIIEQAVQMGVQSVAISGGEPLIWKGLEEAIQLCGRYGIDTTIYTSGNCDSIDAKFKALSEAGLHRAVFSLYSPQKEEHIRITRKRNSYSNTMAAISACLDYGIVPEIHFVALSSNYHKLPDLVKLAQSIGVSTISVLRFVPQGRGELIEKKETLSREQNKELIRMINEIRKSLGSHFNIRTGSPFNVLMLNENPKCMAADDRMIVAPDLTIYPCDAFKQIDAADICKPVVASTLDGNSLELCWKDSSYLNTVRAANLQKVVDPCKSCSAYERCRSGCMAQRFLATGSLVSNRDPACLMTGVSK